MKQLHLTTMVENQIINKILVDGGTVFSILPRSMLQRFGINIEDLIPQNKVVSNFCGKSSDSKGVINLDVLVRNRRIPTMFLVIWKIYVIKIILVFLFPLKNNLIL